LVLSWNNRFAASTWRREHQVWVCGTGQVSDSRSQVSGHLECLTPALIAFARGCRAGRTGLRPVCTGSLRLGGCLSSMFLMLTLSLAMQEAVLDLMCRAVLPSPGPPSPPNPILKNHGTMYQRPPTSVQTHATHVSNDHQAAASTRTRADEIIHSYSMPCNH